MVGYSSNNSESYRVFNPATRRITESRNVVFIEVRSRLFREASEKSPPKMPRWNNEVGGHDYTTDSNFLRGLSDDTSVLCPVLEIPRTTSPTAGFLRS